MGFQDRENKRAGMSVAAAMIQPQKMPPTPAVKGRPKAEHEIKKRISLSILPSLYEQVQKIAYVERQSVSEVVAGCLLDYIEAHKDKLEEYKKIAGK